MSNEPKNSAETTNPDGNAFRWVTTGPLQTLSAQSLNMAFAVVAADGSVTIDWPAVEARATMPMGADITAAWARLVVEARRAGVTAHPEYQRLRDNALDVIGDRWYWSACDADAFEALTALSGYADDRWVDWRSVTTAQDGQWFVWRDPRMPGDIHADKAIVEDGKIEGKHGCGLDFYTECQPCRFADDVKAALIEAGQLEDDTATPGAEHAP